jgi:amidohydrolase
MASVFVEAAQQLELVAWRRDLHRHPELGFQEHRTAGIVAEHLAQLGFDVQTGVATTGVIGVLRGAHPGPVVMVRADMDALPITEANDHEFVSENPGVMHACGHDGHTAIGMGVASVLAQHREELAGTVKMVFQPAEEGLGGAAKMIDEGALEEPRPDVAFGLHLLSIVPSGLVLAGNGPVMAACETFRIVVRGRGGHGAMPQQTVDPLVAGAHIVTALQTVVSRNVDPSEVAVVSVGRFHAGEASNVIAGSAEMAGTVRTFRTATRKLVVERIYEVAEGTARALGAVAQVTTSDLNPPVINEEAVAQHLRAAAQRVVGVEHVSTEQRLMGSEDMAFFLTEVPGCFFFLGAGRSSEEYTHHHPRFDFDEGVLPVGVAILCEAVTDWMRARSS